MNSMKAAICIFGILIGLIGVIQITDAMRVNENLTDDHFTQLKVNESQEKRIIRQGFSFEKSTKDNFVPQGSTIYHSSDGITRVFDPDGNQIIISLDKTAEKVATPVGYLPATKVYIVPSGSVIKEKERYTQVFEKDTPIVTIITEKSPLFLTPLSKMDGWIETSKYLTINNLSRFDANWTVPSHPTNPPNGNISFLFSAIQPSGSGGIVQPVLEWNQVGSGRWTGRAWYGNSNNEYFLTNPVFVNTNDQIMGSMVWDNANEWWKIAFTDQTTGNSAVNFSVQAPGFNSSNLKVFCTLEAYNIINNSDLPGTTTFNEIILKDINENPVSFNWDSWVNQSASVLLPGLGVTSPSQSEVILHTGNEAFTIIPNAGLNGSITPSTPVTVPRGTGITFNISPESNYLIDNITVDGTSVGPVSTYSFANVTSNHTINATFKTDNSMNWIWSENGWAGWETMGGCGEPDICSEYGPVMVDQHGEHGVDVQEIISTQGNTAAQSQVWRDFETEGEGWNTITFNGLLSPTDDPGCRFIDIWVFGDNTEDPLIFEASAAITPPGNGVPFQISRTFPKSKNVFVAIYSDRQLMLPTDPYYRYNMEFYSLNLSLSNSVRNTIEQSKLTTLQNHPIKFMKDPKTLYLQKRGNVSSNKSISI
jgi:hypothetical protein